MTSLQRELVHRRRLTMKLPLSLPIRRIAVTSQGEAIAATLPLGLLAVEPNVNDMRGPG
jgi:hypothetical protein